MAFGIGVVGTGYIARSLAEAIAASSNAQLVAASSRNLATAESFVANWPGTHAVEGYQALLAEKNLDAIYIAAPTSAKEEIALAAIESGLHVLVEKPFTSAASVERMTAAAAAKNILFMDATHFVHHPRTAALKAALPTAVGEAIALHSMLYNSFADRTNIRFSRELEPMGALGDLGWYCLRAVIEYLQPSGAIKQIGASGKHDPETGAVTQVIGEISFETGESSSFGAGFFGSGMIDTLTLVGRAGVVEIGDFVMNWTNSFARQQLDVKTGYTHRPPEAPPSAFAFVETPSDIPQQVLMIDNFVKLARSGDTASAKAFAEATIATQRCLDAIWDEITEK